MGSMSKVKSIPYVYKTAMLAAIEAESGESNLTPLDIQFIVSKQKNCTAFDLKYTGDPIGTTTQCKNIAEFRLIYKTFKKKVLSINFCQACIKRYVKKFSENVPLMLQKATIEFEEGFKKEAIEETREQFEHLEEKLDYDPSVRLNPQFIDDNTTVSNRGDEDTGRSIRQYYARFAGLDIEDVPVNQPERVSDRWMDAIPRAATRRVRRRTDNEQ